MRDPGRADLSSQTSPDLALAAADWSARIGDPNVVWYHNFDSASEVDAFRWTGGKGNDPTGDADKAAAPDGLQHCHWEPTGGADGGGFMQVDRPQGTYDVGMWWRPFSPLNGASNGRGVDDPAANGTLTVGSFDASYHATLEEWAKPENAKQGWYGPSPDSFFDGTDFYLQVRVMADPRRTTPGNIQGGKFVWLTTTWASYISQELVSYQASTEHATMHAVGEPNYFNMYRGSDFSDIYSASTTMNGLDTQLGSEIPGECDPYESHLTGCWSYATDGTWDTLLYHITPGQPSQPTTRIQVWAAHSGHTTYTKITDVFLATVYDTSSSAVGAVGRVGWNAVILGAYANGFQGVPNSAFFTRYDQVIFSKAFIACPAT
jgi:hypothetical protein